MAPLALLVDRDADGRQMYAEYLRAAEFLVDEADDGREALAKAISGHPDIVVTEIRLHGMDGFALCDEIRRDPAIRHTPVVFVSTDATDTVASRARTVGANSVLVKPCLPEVLFAEILRLLSASKDLRDRSSVLGAIVASELDRSSELLERSRRAAKRVPLSHALGRHFTTTPETPPPSLLCPSCDRPLKYCRSHIGGVSLRNREQWDYYECPAGCGNFQYRPRTKKLRAV